MIEAIKELYPNSQAIEWNPDKPNKAFVDGHEIEVTEQIKAKHAEIIENPLITLKGRIEAIDKLKAEIQLVEQQCMRPLLEIHYLQRQGKDTAKEDAFLNSRYGEILAKRAQISAIENNP